MVLARADNGCSSTDIDHSYIAYIVYLSMYRICAFSTHVNPHRKVNITVNRCFQLYISCWPQHQWLILKSFIVGFKVTLKTRKRKSTASAARNVLTIATGTSTSYTDISPGPVGAASITAQDINVCGVARDMTCDTIQG